MSSRVAWFVAAPSRRLVGSGRIGEAMTTQNLWILFLMFGASLVSWVFNHLREQAKLRQAKEQARRQYEEHLRTGRVPEGGRAASGGPERVSSSSSSSSEVAERRQAQLRDLRRQQEVARGGTSVVVAKSPTGPTVRGARPGPPTIVLGPGGVVIQRGPGPARAPVPSARLPRPGVGLPAEVEEVDPRIEFGRKRLREQAEREAALLRAAQAEQALEVEEARRRSAVVAPAAAAPAVVRRGGLDVRGIFTGRNRAELRRLMAINEVLSPPMSLRGGVSSC